MLAPDIISETSLCRLRLVVRGAVQGVGFRPFVYRLATQLDLHGWVLNASEGVVAEVEGSFVNVEQFRQRVEREHPPPFHHSECKCLLPRPGRLHRI